MTARVRSRKAPPRPLRLVTLEPGDESDPAWPCVRASFDAGGTTLDVIIRLVDAYAIDLKLSQALSRIHRLRAASYPEEE